MIEAQTAGELNTQQQATTTPQTITTTMIVEDLDNGIDREGIRLKYNLEKWEVAEVFKHPSLKGKKVRKKRRLSFQFLDDTPAVVDPAQTSIPVEPENVTAVVDVQSFPSSGGWDNQTRVEEGLDHKGETLNDTDNLNNLI
jgi:hypothetical protein